MPKNASGTSASEVPLWRNLHGDGFGVLLLARSSGDVWLPFGIFSYCSSLQMYCSSRKSRKRNGIVMSVEFVRESVSQLLGPDRGRERTTFLSPSNASTRVRNTRTGTRE